MDLQLRENHHHHGTSDTKVHKANFLCKVRRALQPCDFMFLRTLRSACGSPASPRPPSREKPLHRFRPSSSTK